MCLAYREIDSFCTSTCRGFEAAIEEIVHQCAFSWWLSTNHRDHIDLFMLRYWGRYFLNKFVKEIISKLKSFSIDEIDLVGWLMKKLVIFENRIFEKTIFLCIGWVTENDLLDERISRDIQFLKLLFFGLDLLFELKTVVFRKHCVIVDEINFKFP